MQHQSIRCRLVVKVHRAAFAGTLEMVSSSVSVTLLCFAKFSSWSVVSCNSNHPTSAPSSNPRMEATAALLHLSPALPDQGTI